MPTRIIRKFEFHAAHHLETFPEGHKCRNMHGHSYIAQVILEGEPDPSLGYFLDFGELKAVLAPVEQQLDHAYLNDIPGLTLPTTELLAKWIYDQLKPNLPQLTMIRLQETANNAVEYSAD